MFNYENKIIDRERLEEGGVSYTFDEKCAELLRYAEFKYTAMHNANGEIMEISCKVYCNTKHEFLQLLNHWNTKAPFDWLYVE